MAGDNRAFIEDGLNGIREMTLAESNAMLGRIAYLYQQSQPITLSVVSSNGNITPNMTDTRYKSGTAKRNTSGAWPAVTTYPPQTSTGEPELVTGVTYDKISQTLSTPTTFSNSDYQSLNIKPVWLESDGTLREMDYNKLLEQFAGKVADAMIATNTVGDQAGGSYFISTAASVSGATNLGTVFVDTSANASAYQYDLIGLANTYQDHFDSTTYYLYRVESSISSQGSGYRTPLVIDYTANRKNTPGGLRHMTYAEFDSLFAPMIRYALHSVPGYTLRYNVNGNGTRQGTLIANRQMIGVSGLYTKYEASGDDYRAQEFPNGTLVNYDEYELKIERT